MTVTHCPTKHIRLGMWGVSYCEVHSKILWDIYKIKISLGGDKIVNRRGERVLRAGFVENWVLKSRKLAFK